MSHSDNCHHFGDVIIFGAQKVGKTAIADRFVNNYFTEDYKPTYREGRYAVEALIETMKDELAMKESKKKQKMIFKKSFKKSLFGKSRPPLKNKQTLKRVLSRNASQLPAGRAFQQGLKEGFRKLAFTLVDTPMNMNEMEPISYAATIANAEAFFLVCSFDNKDSLEYVKEKVSDIRNKRDDSVPVILIANKIDLEQREKVLDENDINSLSEELCINYCVSSVASEEGCEDMCHFLLGEINASCEEKDYQASLPEDDVYFDQY